MNKKEYLNWIAVACFVFLNAFVTEITAQDVTTNLSLSEAVTAALAANKDLQAAELDENIALANYKQTEAVFLPQVTASYTAMSTDNPLNAFGFKLQQRTITQNDFNPDLLNHPSGTKDFMGKLEVQQPLINLDLLYKRKGAEKQTALYRFKTLRTKEYLTFEVQKAYLQLQLAYDANRVLEEALVTVKSVYKFTANHFQQGLIKKTDLLNAQVHVATVESNLSKSKSAIHNSSDHLGLLMGRKMGLIYKTRDGFNDQVSKSDITQLIDSSRADFMAMQKAIESSDLMIKSSQMSYLPKLNAFGNYQYNDSHLTGFGARSYFAGIQLSWDIFKGGGTKNTIVAQKLERDKLSIQLTQQKDQSQLDLNRSFRALADARLEILKLEESIEQSSEALRILQNRYQQGLENTTDVLMAETQLSQQKFDLAQAVFTSNVTKAYMQFLTSSTTK
ncbi:TolC family protein [Arcticibacter eurypsychrophilus]|uniref:TolC family protein n=1 Tax=Arcticibacter eurypsychrophilus TaxID=1434752 RepID=UPI00084D659E|nr:TolC family protein [Arcticibacter eurypsychrophilus]